MADAGTAGRDRGGGPGPGGERGGPGVAAGVSGAERHEIVGEMVVRGVRAALDTLQRDLPATGRVVAIGELREVLRLLGTQGTDAT